MHVTRPPRTEESQPRRDLMDLVMGVALLLLQAAASWVSLYVFILQALSVAGCGDRCDYALADASHRTQLWGSLLLLIAAAVAVVWLWLCRKPTWRAPVIGIGAVVLLTIATCIGMDIATPTL